tara:strand:+ start:1679 stop:2284 length:606 start_codon:yes stop_codon:yes gene_type:complete
VGRKNLSEKAQIDLKLINRAIEIGDPRAYNELMSRYRDKVYFMLLEKVREKELAKELTIEAFGKAFKKLHLYKPDYAFSTWLFSVARNNCIDFLRKKKLPTVSIDAFTEDEEGSKITFDLTYEGLNPEGQLVKKQRIQFLRRIVADLKPKYRELVKLRYFKEYTYDEIAVKLDIPIGTVKAQLHRSREQLFKILSGCQEKI